MLPRRPRRTRTLLVVTAGALAGGAACASAMTACMSFGSDRRAVEGGPGDGGLVGDGAAPGTEGGTEGGGGERYRDRILADGPIVYWRMGARSGPAVKDETGNGNDLVLQGSSATSFTLGVEGAIAFDDDTAIAFDGVAGSAAATNSGAFDFPEKAPFTIELWAKRAAEGPTTFQHVLSRLVGVPGNRTGFAVFITPEGLAGAGSGTVPGVYFEYDAVDGGDQATRAPLAPVGEWVHYAAVMDGTAITLFADANPAAPKPVLGPLTVSAIDLVVGSRPNGENGFAGAVDEVAIYARALSSAEIAAHRSLGRPR